MVVWEMNMKTATGELPVEVAKWQQFVRATQDVRGFRL
jgi:hypothetical protein